jgi:hypothetical protein
MSPENHRSDTFYENGYLIVVIVAIGRYSGSKLWRVVRGFNGVGYIFQNGKGAFGFFVLGAGSGGLRPESRLAPFICPNIREISSLPPILC